MRCQRAHVLLQGMYGVITSYFEVYHMHTSYVSYGTTAVVNVCDSILLVSAFNGGGQAPPQQL